MEKPDSLSSCRCEACQSGREHDTELMLVIIHDWNDGGYKIYRKSIGLGFDPIVRLKDSAGFMFVFFLESIRPGFVAELRSNPMAPKLKGQWPADDYDGLYAEYYWQRFHRFPLETKTEVDDLLKELGL